jgi:carboxypeptidase C (cathepsin A)
MQKSLLALFLVVTIVFAQKAEHEVKSFPFQDHITKLSSRWYSGYFDVSRYKSTHYFFIESLDKPETDPIVIFFNGGPGASSTQFAFLNVGPYSCADPENNYKFTEFKDTWARNASLLFIDNPIGAGFSHGEREIDKINSDYSYRRDILKFIQTFYSFWPTLASNPLYIFGVSFGGVFGPTLAHAIAQLGSSYEFDSATYQSERIHCG